MDKITQQTLRQLDQVEKDLRDCQTRLKKSAGHTYRFILVFRPKPTTVLKRSTLH